MLRHAMFALALVSLAAACGEDENILPQPVDAGVDTDANVDADTTPRPTAVVVTGDFSVTGILTTIDVATATPTRNALAGVAGGEPWIRKFGDEYFIVNRAGGNNVTIVGGSPLRFIDQFGTGGGSNPQDVAVVGNKLYVPIFDGIGGLKVIDRTTRMVKTVMINVDSDNAPNCISAYAVGDRVFVACDIFDANFMPRGVGKIAVINTADDTVATTFDLANANPFGRFVRSPESSMFGGDLLIPTVPALTSYTNGGLERVSVGTTPAANGYAVQNSAIAGYVAAADIAADGATLWIAAFALNANFTNNFGRLRPINLATGVLGAEASPTTQLISSVAACPGGYVVAGDITMGTSGVRIYQDGTERTTAVIDVGRPVNAPNGIVCH